MSSGDILGILRSGCCLSRAALLETQSFIQKHKVLFRTVGNRDRGV